MVKIYRPPRVQLGSVPTSVRAQPPGSIDRCSTTILHPLEKTKKSPWSKVKNPFTRAAIRSAVLRWCFCFDGKELEELEADAVIRDNIRNCMKQHTDIVYDNAVKDLVKQIRLETGYDMSDARSKLRKVLRSKGKTGTIAPETKPEIFWNLYKDDSKVAPVLAGLGIESMEAFDQCFSSGPKEVGVVPKFAAGIVVHLRSKFGHLPLTDANRLLIEREYLRACREGFVRESDIISHYQHVMNAYFTEGVLSEVAQSRSRAPRWLRGAYGKAKYAPATVC